MQQLKTTKNDYQIESNLIVIFFDLSKLLQN